MFNDPSLLDVTVGSFLHTVVQILQIYQAQEKSYRHHKAAKALAIDKAVLYEPYYPKAEFLIGAFISSLVFVRRIDPAFGLHH